MRIYFQTKGYSDVDGTTPSCRFLAYLIMPGAIETQEEAVRCILAQLETMLAHAREDLPKAEIWVDDKQLPREAEKGGGNA